MSSAETAADLQAPDIRSLESAYRGRGARVAVIGLGYVGLPLALALTGAGFTVTGFDIDPAKAAALNGGRSYIRQIDDGRVAQAVATGRFRATADADEFAAGDAVIGCVPTPLSPQREPDQPRGAGPRLAAQGWSGNHGAAAWYSCRNMSSREAGETVRSSMPSAAAAVSPNANASSRTADATSTVPTTSRAAPAIATDCHVDPARDPSSQLRISR